MRQYGGCWLVRRWNHWWRVAGTLTWTRPHCWRTGWLLNHLWAARRCGSPEDCSLVALSLRRAQQHQASQGRNFVSNVCYTWSSPHRHTPGRRSRLRTTSWGWRAAPAPAGCLSCRSRDFHRSRGHTSWASSVWARTLQRRKQQVVLTDQVRSSKYFRFTSGLVIFWCERNKCLKLNKFHTFGFWFVQMWSYYLMQSSYRTTFWIHPEYINLTVYIKLCSKESIVK